MELNVDIKSVYLPKPQENLIRTNGEMSHYKTPIDFEKQNGLVKYAIINSINEGDIKLKEYYIKNGKLYIEEADYCFKEG